MTISKKWARGVNLRSTERPKIYNLKTTCYTQSKPKPKLRKIVIVDKVNRNIKLDDIAKSNLKESSNNNKKRSRDDFESFDWNDFNVFRQADNINNTQRTDKKDWVSATSVKNYLLKEPLIDWLDLYYHNLGYNDEPNNNVWLAEKDKKKKEMEKDRQQLNIFFEMGNRFESEVMKYLKDKYPESVKKVVTKFVKIEDSELTLTYMKAGIPIIEQAALYNNNNKTYGIADILIRSDWINKLFDRPVISPDEEHIKGHNLNGKYHYRVIDIKWSGMHLCADGKSMRNENRFPAYKGQLTIYNAALGVMQGFIPDEAYVLAKSWKHDNENGYNCFNRLGSVDFNNFDNHYIKETSEAIKWIRDVRYNGDQWNCTTPSIPELYPNMCNRYDTPYHSVKKDLSDKLKELTQLWNVGVKNRRIAHSNGVFSWDDPACSAETMGIYGQKIGPIVDQIIHINRDSEELISPTIIHNNTFDWQQRHALDFYIDFEGVTGCLYYQNINLQHCETDSQLLFLIGVGYEENNSWKYKLFLANNISRNEEKRITTEMIEFIETKRNEYIKKNNIKNKNLCKPKLFHWSHAEKTILNTLDKRYNNEFYNWINNVTWIDMCKIFMDEPIVLKGAKKFNLKEIAHTMYKHGMITTKWQADGPDSGLAAMFDAIQYYKYSSRVDTNTNPQEIQQNQKIMDSIVNYNEVDCKAVYEIVKYLRNNNIE